MGSEAPYKALDRRPTPLPLAALGALSVGLFTNSLVVTVLFPFAPVMVASFGVTDDEAKLGYYAGFLASSFFFGSLIAGPLWGFLADRLGRKTVLVIGLCSNAIFGTMFGFSTNFPMAMATRFTLGLLSTVFIAAKTAMTELCDDTNQAQGFAAFGLCWGLGLIIGPVIGGILAEPAQQYPSFFSETGLFGHFPFLLPNLLIGIFTCVGLALCLLFLPETLGKAKLFSAEGLRPPSEAAGEEVPDAPMAAEGRPAEAGVQEEGLQEPLLGHVAKREGANEAGLELAEEDPGMFRVIFCEPDTLLTGAIFCLCGFMFVGFDELFPLWSLTDWEIGGLSFTTRNVGLAQGASGVALIPITLVVYPWLVNKIGAVGALQLSLGTGILQALIPFIRHLGPDRMVLQITCMVIFAIRSFNETGMAAMFILTGNSVRYPKYMGAVNGFLATFQALFRSLAPTVIGSLFAWTASGHRAFPFDFHFAWLFLGGLHIVALAMTLTLPAHINYRKFSSAQEF